MGLWMSGRSHLTSPNAGSSVALDVLSRPTNLRLAGKPPVCRNENPRMGGRVTPYGQRRDALGGWPPKYEPPIQGGRDTERTNPKATAPTRP